MADNQALPTLRYRDGATDKQFGAPVTLMGRVVDADIDVVHIEQARGHETQLYIIDLAPVLGGPDRALGLMLDASDHEDRVKIALTRDKITYDNEAQLERFRAKAASAPKE